MSSFALAVSVCFGMKSIGLLIPSQTNLTPGIRILIGYFAVPKFMPIVVNPRLTLREFIQNVMKQWVQLFTSNIRLIDQMREIQKNDLSYRYQIVFNYLTFSFPNLHLEGIDSELWMPKQVGFDCELSCIVNKQEDNQFRGVFDYESAIPSLDLKRLSNTFEKSITNLQPHLQDFVKNYIEKHLRELSTKICIVSSFTLDPLEESLSFWQDKIPYPFDYAFRSMQSGLQSLFGIRKAILYKIILALNVILVSWEDAVRYKGEKDKRTDEEMINSFARELLSRLEHALTKHLLPYVIIVCPPIRKIFTHSNRQRH